MKLLNTDIHVSTHKVVQMTLMHIFDGWQFYELFRNCFVMLFSWKYVILLNIKNTAPQEIKKTYFDVYKYGTHYYFHSMCVGKLNLIVLREKIKLIS